MRENELQNELQTTHDHKNIFGSHDVQLDKIIVHLHKHITVVHAALLFETCTTLFSCL